MSRKFEDKLDEWAAWWDEHKSEVRDPMQRQKFMLKCLEGFFDLFAYIANDLREAEGRRAVQNSSLWLPHGMIKFKDDPKPNPEDRRG